MPEMRQKLLVLYLRTPELHSGVVAWSEFNGAVKRDSISQHSSGDGAESGEERVVASNGPRYGCRVYAITWNPSDAQFFGKERWRPAGGCPASAVECVKLFVAGRPYQCKEVAPDACVVLGRHIEDRPGCDSGIHGVATLPKDF